MSSSPPPLTKSLLLILLIFSSVLLLGSGENFAGSESSFSPAEFQGKMMSRKLIGVDHALLDYEPPGANPAHEPKKGSGGKGGP